MHGFHWNTVYQSFYNICTIYIIIWFKYTSEVQKQHEKIWNPLKFEIFLYKAELTDRNKNKNISQWMEIVDDVCHDWEWILQKKIKVTLKFEIFYIGRRNFQQTHLTWHFNILTTYYPWILMYLFICPFNISQWTGIKDTT